MKLTKSTVVGTLMALPAVSMAAVDQQILDAVNNGFSDAKTIGVAILIGVAGIFGLMLAKRLLR